MYSLKQFNTNSHVLIPLEFWERQHRLKSIYALRLAVELYLLDSQQSLNGFDFRLESIAMVLDCSEFEAKVALEELKEIGIILK